MQTASSPFVPLLAVLLLAPVLTAQETRDPIPEGTYVFVPGESDEIEGRIDEAVAHMNFLVRRIARGRLRGANEPIDRIDLRYRGDSVWISLREGDPWIVSLRNGEPGPFTRPDGEVVQVSTELSPGVIDQFFESDEGEKRMIYRLRDDGLLTLESTVYSDRLKEPFRYTWVYRSVDAEL